MVGGGGEEGVTPGRKRREWAQSSGLSDFLHVNACLYLTAAFMKGWQGKDAIQLRWKIENGVEGFLLLHVFTTQQSSVPFAFAFILY